MTNTEDYQPQGADFRVEYLYCGFRFTLVFHTSPTSVHRSTLSRTYFNQLSSQFNAIVFGMRSCLRFYWPLIVPRPQFLRPRTLSSRPPCHQHALLLLLRRWLQRASRHDSLQPRRGFEGSGFSAMSDAHHPTA